MLGKEERREKGLEDALEIELARRRSKNPRYSLRAFARDLRLDHASLSQILRGARAIGPGLRVRMGRRIGLTGAALAALAISPGARLSKNLLSLLSFPEFRPDSRWIAGVLGCTVDDVNVTLAHLAREGRLRMDSPTSWRRARARRRLPFSKPGAARAQEGA